MSRCAHGYPSPASCIDCMDEGVMAPPPALPKRAGWPFVAQLEGTTCSGCHVTVDVGEKILRMDDDTYRHLACEKVRSTTS